MMEHMLSGIPLTDGFSKVIDWHDFEDRTTHASGDVIGKVFDRVFRRVRDKLLEEYGVLGMQTIEDRVKEINAEGKFLTQDMRAQIFRDTTGGNLLISPADFMADFNQVMQEKDVIEAMHRQERFYREIDDRMGQAEELDD